MSRSRTERFIDFFVGDGGFTNENYELFNLIDGLEMEDILSLLHTERQNNSVYNQYWNIARSELFGKIQMVKYNNPDFNRVPIECHIAVVLYTLECPIYRDFNQKCRNFHPSQWWSFPYKSFYGLLYNSIRGVKRSDFAPLYRGMDVRLISNTGRSIKTFSYFTSWSRDSNVPYGFIAQKNKGTFLTYVNCPIYGIDISHHSVSPWEKETLVFPCEKFRIREINVNQYIVPVKIESLE